MRRSALAVFFERVIVASLPLVAPACHDSASTTAPPTNDLAVVVPTDAAQMLPSVDLIDNCDNQYPVTQVNMDRRYFPDGGFQTECITGPPCTDVCPPGYQQCCAPTPSDGGAVTVDCSLPCPGGGRRPEGLAPAVGRRGCEVGAYFAAMAHLEAASVTAFRRLGRELRLHGAPRSLVAAARRALTDEVRHARTMRALAARHGHVAARVRVAAAAPRRSIEAIARENAVEGCVRETYGALVASWQARAAAGAGVAAAMAGIAADETRHAELAWRVDAFFSRALDRAAVRRVRRARHDAVEALAADLAAAPPPSLVAHVGLPDRDRARSLFDATRAALWT